MAVVQWFPIGGLFSRSPTSVSVQWRGYFASFRYYVGGLWDLGLALGGSGSGLIVASH